MIRFAENLNKMIAAGLGGAMEAPSTEVAVGHRLCYMDASGPVANFETNIAAPIRSLRVDMLPIQAGSGDPSPDNIRPISGRDSVTVTRTGVNLFPNPSGARSAVDLKAGVEYCFSAKGASSAVAVAGKYADGTTFPTLFLNKLSGDIRYNSRVLEKDVSEIVIYLNNVTLYDCQIEVGSTPSAYAPYDGTSITVQLGQTVYGGTLDVSTGKLTVTHGEIASYNGEVLTGEWISDRDVYAAGTTPTIGAQVVYVLDTPQTIDLDLQQITTLIGDNNVWSDAGDVALEYPYYEETEGY